MSMRLKSLFGMLLTVSGICWFLRCVYANRKVTIVIYHDPEPALFDAHLAYFTSRYNVIPFSRFFDCHQQRDLRSLPPRSLVITFDDGHARNFQLTESLRKHRVSPLLYLCSQIVGTNRRFWWQSEAASRLGIDQLKSLPDEERRERLVGAGFLQTEEQPVADALSSAQLDVMRDVFEFGAHTRFHPILTRCTDQRCQEEIAGARSEISEAIGSECLHFAYPNGNYGERETTLVANAGYASGRTIDVGWNCERTDPYRFKIMPVDDRSSVWWLKAQLTGIPALLKNIIRHGRFTMKLVQH